MSCERCAELTGLISGLEEANAELGRQNAGLEHNLRRAGSAEVALRNELNRIREEEPDSPAVKALLIFWRDECKGGDKKVKIDLNGPRGKKVKWALKKYGDERCRKAILGAKLDDWAMGRAPKIRNSGKTFNDIAKHILLDEETIERFEALYENGPQRPPVEGPTGVEPLLEKLEGVRRGDNAWYARCPAHDDKQASLQIRQGHKGAVVKCYTGCDVADIAEAVGMSVSALFDPEPGSVPPPPVRPSKPLPTGEQILQWRDALLARPGVLRRLYDLKRWSPTTLKTLSIGIDGDRLTFPVTNADGNLVQLLRYKPGDSRKILAWGGKGRDLFPPPELFPGEVWLVEGEPDAVSGHELGLPAVAVPGTGGWKSEYAERFRDRQVFVCFDCDGPGRALEGRVVSDLVMFAKEVWTVDLAPGREDGFDLSDALLQGIDVESVRGLAVNLATEVAG